MNMSENASFAIRNKHIAFARLEDTLQSMEGNKDISKIYPTSNTDNVTKIVLFVVLCVVVNLFMSFCRCLFTRFCLHLPIAKDEIVTQKGQGLFTELPGSSRCESLSTIENMMYAPSVPLSEYRVSLPRLYRSPHCPHFIGHTPQQLAVLKPSCAYSTRDIPDPIPNGNYVVYQKTSPERLI